MRAVSLISAFTAIHGQAGETPEGDSGHAPQASLCYQCKLCYFKCPYTPDDEHAFMLDFPRLMLRHKAQRARRNGGGGHHGLL